MDTTGANTYFNQNMKSVLMGLISILHFDFGPSKFTVSPEEE